MKQELDMTPEDRKLREQFQRAVRSQEVPAALSNRVRSAVRASQLPRPQFRWLALAAAFAVVFMGSAVAYQLGHLRLTTASQESYITSVSNRVATIMRAGIRDHIHCAVYRKYPKNAPRVEELAQSMSPEYRGLVEIVRKHVPSEYRLMIAHECRHRGRKFIHLALKSDSRLLSLVLTRKQEGESFVTEGLLPVEEFNGVPVYRAAAQRFEIAAFESGEHLAYVISDLPRDGNLKLMLALTPDVKELLSGIES